jgi:hypothetical protein
MAQASTEALLEEDQATLQADETPARAHFPKTRSGILFFATGEDLSVPGARELLQKMIASLGLGSDTTRIEELAEAGEHLNSEIDFDGNLAVVLGEDAAYRLGLFDGTGVRAIVSHSLQSLLANVALKRESWQHLQLAAREVGWTIPTRG